MKLKNLLYVLALSFTLGVFTFFAGAKPLSEPKADVKKAKEALDNCGDDEVQCSVAQTNYNNAKKALEEKKSQLALEEYKKQKSSETPVEQLAAQRKQAEMLGALGVGASVYLAHKAIAPCTSCWSPDPDKSKCYWCYGYLGATAFAVGATENMFDKAKKFRGTEVSMCDEVSVASGSCGGAVKLPPTMEIPGCEKSPSTCDRLMSHFKGSDGDCAPGDSSCAEDSKKLSDDPKKLAEIIKPKGGWPEGKNPFDKKTGEGVTGKGFSYDTLTPQQKKAHDTAMKPLKDKQADFIAKYVKAGEDEEDEADNDVLAETSKALTGNFSPGRSKDQVSSAVPNVRPRRQQPEDTLTAQMQAMMSSIYGGKKKRAPAESFADRSVWLGSDVVGVAEDNIFMMVHRRHRNLAEENRFIKNGF